MDPVQPVQPIIVRVVGEPTKELGFGQIIAQALGLAGIILIVSLVLGLAMGAAIVWLRRRRESEREAGEAGDQIKLRLEVPRSSKNAQPPAVHHTI
jgi:hypothetical protein